MKNGCRIGNLALKKRERAKRESRFCGNKMKWIYEYDKSLSSLSYLISSPPVQVVFLVGRQQEEVSHGEAEQGPDERDREDAAAVFP